MTTVLDATCSNGLSADEAVADPTAVQPRRARWWLVHPLVGLAFVVVLNLFLGPDGFLSADEQVSHEQVTFLSEGDWTRPMPEPVIDPDARWHPMNSVSVGDGVVAPYAKHPAFPLLLTPFDAAFGRLGRFLAVGLGSVVAAAVLAVAAERRRADTATTAFWMMLLGSPMVLHAAVLWGHSWAIACACLAMIGVQRVVSEHRCDLVAAGLLIVAGTGAVAMRSDALIFFVLLGAVLALDGLLARWWREAALGAALVLFTIALYVIEARWRLSILGPSRSVGLSAPSEPMFDLTIRSSLVTKWTLGNDAGILGLLRVVGLGLLVVEALRLRDAKSSLRMPVVALAAGCYLVAIGAGSTYSFVVTAPLLFLGLTLIRTADRLVGVVAATSVLFFGAIVMTSYAAAGGGDWGGRYVSLLLAPLMLLAAPEIARVLDDGRHRRLLLAGAVASATIVVGITLHLQQQRSITQELLAESRMELDDFSEPGDIVILTDARMGRLLGESDIDRRFFRVNPEELEIFADAVGAEVSSVVIFDFLNPVDVPAEWIVVEESESMRRVRW